MTAFLLITASRLHTPQNTAHIIEAGLAEGWRYLGGGDEIVLIHGAQGVWRGDVLVSGGDAIAAQLWKRRGYEDDPHPADWSACDDAWPKCNPGHRRSRNGRQYCPEAGFRRNQEMVDVLAAWRDLGHRVHCIGFPMPGQRSGGTYDCMRRAKAAGIEPWRRWDPSVRTG